MSWREALLTRFGGGGLAGITLGVWLRVLRDNHFAVDRPYWGKLLGITFASIPNTLFGGCENFWYRWASIWCGDFCGRTRYPPPPGLFIFFSHFPLARYAMKAP